MHANVTRKFTYEPIQYSGNYDGNDGEDVGDIY